MKNLDKLFAPKCSTTDHRLTQTTPLAQFKWADALAPYYNSSDRKHQLFASLMNAIYTHRMPVFALSGPMLANLVNNDANQPKKTKAISINGRLFSELICKLRADNILPDGTSEPAGFQILVKAPDNSGKADLWCLAGEQLEAFVEAFPGMAARLDDIKQAAIKYYSNPDPILSNQPAPTPAADPIAAPATAPVIEEPKIGVETQFTVWGELRIDHDQKLLTGTFTKEPEFIIAWAKNVESIAKYASSYKWQISEATPSRLAEEEAESAYF